MGLYTNTVDGLFTNYVIPQENGNHMGCKWVSMTNNRYGSCRLYTGPYLILVRLGMKIKI